MESGQQGRGIPSSPGLLPALAYIVRRAPPSFGFAITEGPAIHPPSQAITSIRLGQSAGAGTVPAFI